MSIYFKNNLDDVKKELKASLEFHNTALEIWETVTIEKKKDGSEYKTLSRALNNAQEVCSCGEFRQLQITFRTPLNGYKSESIDIYGYLDELPDTDERKKAYVKQFMRQKYDFTADEIRHAIEIQKAYHKETIQDLTKELKNIETAYNTFHAGLTELLKQLEHDTFCEHKDTYPNGKKTYPTYKHYTNAYYSILAQH